MATSTRSSKNSTRYSQGFDPDLHPRAVGVANQTTMLRGETEEVQRRFKAAMIKKHGEARAEKHFRFFDTICGATQDRQDALEKMLREPMNFSASRRRLQLVQHLASGGNGRNQAAPYFIKNASKMISAERISHYDQHQRTEVETPGWLPAANHRGHHCRRELSEQLDRGYHPPAVRTPEYSAAAGRSELIGAFPFKLPRIFAMPRTRQSWNSSNVRRSRRMPR